MMKKNIVALKRAVFHFFGLIRLNRASFFHLSYKFGQHLLIPPKKSNDSLSCKILGCHSGDYEERRLLGYTNPVRTSQEIHYVSAKGPGRLMLCKICGFHGGDYEECRLLEYNKTSSYLAEDTLLLRYRAQSVTAM
jgi:hypothetical protein